MGLFFFVCFVIVVGIAIVIISLSCPCGVKFLDVNDPLAGLLSEEEQDVPKKPSPKGSEGSQEKKTELGKEKGKQGCSVHPFHIKLATSISLCEFQMTWFHLL